jgi:hypothetical protein
MDPNEISRLLSESLMPGETGLLIESICPACRDPGAYIGFNTVECPNKQCRFFEPTMVSQTPINNLVQYFEKLDNDPQANEALATSISSISPRKLLEMIPEIGKNEDIEYGPMRAKAIYFMLKHNHELAKATNTSAEEFWNNYYYNYENFLAKALAKLLSNR